MLYRRPTRVRPRKLATQLHLAVLRPRGACHRTYFIGMRYVCCKGRSHPLIPRRPSMRMPGMRMDGGGVESQYAVRPVWGVRRLEYTDSVPLPRTQEVLDDALSPGIERHFVA